MKPLLLTCLLFLMLVPSALSVKMAVPLVTIKTNGGLCASRCDGITTITSENITVSVGGKIVKKRLLKDSERNKLIASIKLFHPAKLKPFRGTCPIAYDGQEHIYTIHGFKGSYSDCRFSLRRVSVILIANQILVATR